MLVRRHGVMALAGLTVSVLVSGCLYGRSFSCKGYPEGVQCQDVMTVYENRHAPPPPQKGEHGEEGESAVATAAGAGGASTLVGAPEVQLGQPMLSAPKVVRVWVAPWRDDKNRLHEAAFLYLMVEDSDWVYARERKAKAGKARPRGTIVPTISSLIERPGDRQQRHQGDLRPHQPPGRQPHQATPPQSLLPRQMLPPGMPAPSPLVPLPQAGGMMLPGGGELGDMADDLSLGGGAFQ